MGEIRVFWGILSLLLGYFSTMSAIIARFVYILTLGRPGASTTPHGDVFPCDFFDDFKRRNCHRICYYIGIEDTF